MKRFVVVITLGFLAGCAPLIEPVPEETETPLPPAAQVEEEAPEIAIAERLLPNGFLEVGDQNAPLTLLLFTEHHCRYCKQFQHEQFLRLYADFIETGSVKLQIGILPMKKYPDGQRALLGLVCAAKQEKGIGMHKLLFEIGARDEEVLLAAARTLELDEGAFAECLQSEEAQKAVDQQKAVAQSLDVTLVPTFFLDGEKSVGLPYYADLRGMINEKLE